MKVSSVQRDTVGLPREQLEEMELPIGSYSIWCQTVPTVPRAPTVEGESLAQAATQHRVCMPG